MSQPLALEPTFDEFPRLGEFIKAACEAGCVYGQYPETAPFKFRWLKNKAKPIAIPLSTILSDNDRLTPLVAWNLERQLGIKLAIVPAMN